MSAPRCDCGTELNDVDIDRNRGVGLCPRCANLVRLGVSASTECDVQLVAPSSENPAIFSPFRESAVALVPVAPAPLVAMPSYGWEERAIVGGALEVVATKRTPKPARRGMLGAFFVALSLATLGYGTRSDLDSFGIVLLLTLFFMLLGAIFLARTWGGRIRGAKFRFRHGALDVETRLGIQMFHSNDVLEFGAIPISSKKIGQTRDVPHSVELRTRSGNVPTFVRLANQSEIVLLTARLNDLLRLIKSG